MFQINPSIVSQSIDIRGQKSPYLCNNYLLFDTTKLIVLATTRYKFKSAMSSFRCGGCCFSDLGHKNDISKFSIQIVQHF